MSPSRDYYLKNKERIKAAAKAYAVNYPERVREYRRRNREKSHAERHAAQVAWRKQNPDKVAKTAWRVHLKKKFGISEADYSSLLAAQNGVCAICGGVSSDRRLAVDHDHKTGKIRGLLCNACNRALGVVETREGWLEHADKYLRQNTVPEEKLRVFVTDIDSVLLDISTPLERAVNKLFGKYKDGGNDVATEFMHYSYDGWHIGMWDLALAFGLSKEDMDAVWDEAFASPSLPYPGAIEFVQELKARGFKVVGLTKRGGKRFLDPCFRDTPILDLDTLLIADNHQQKGPFVAEIPGAEFFIDDKIGNIYSVLEHCPKIKTFLVDQPWNASLDLKVPYKRVHSFAQVMDEAL